MKSRHVAVIGAGASGLVAARELRREGHTVVVFERGDKVGGVWVYTPDSETDPLGLDPNRNVIHCSLYNSLRTNLPREVMGFRDYPFVGKEGGDQERDQRRFPGHKEVLMYLKDFAKEFEIEELVRFETEVIKVKFMVEIGKWKVETKKKKGGFCGHELFDAVVVCSGHYWDPLIAEIPGIASWPGKQLHSHNYRTPNGFQDKIVILVGSSVSANDISRELAGVAKEVHVACRSPGFLCLDASVDHETKPKLPGYDNIWIHSMIQIAHANGTVVFQDGSTIFADFILHCTGYKYHFPFLETNGIVTIHDARVGPLYKHVFPPILAPHLSFVGLTWRAVPFPVFELQSKWIAGALSNRIALPSPEDMVEDVKAFYASLEASEKPIRYTHNVGSYQFEYIDWLVTECKAPSHEEWRKEMVIATFIKGIARPISYRDECDDQDQHLVLQARESFIKHLK